MLRKPTFKSAITTLLKLGFSVAAMVFIFSYLDFQTLLKHVKTLNPAIIGLALLLAIVSQYIAARRLQFYCSTKALALSHAQSIRLYFTGVFFNVLLPGGVGGDGYVAIMLKHLYKLPIKDSIALLLSARASGLLVLILLAIGISYFAQYPEYLTNSYTMLTILLALTVLTYSLCVRKILGEKYHTQIKAALYSLGVQGAIACAMYLLLEGMGISPGLILDYLALLLFSSVLVILPISFGGLGLRELGFLYGSQVIGLNAEIGVAVSLLYHGLNLTLGLVGLWFFATSKTKHKENEHAT